MITFHTNLDEPKYIVSDLKKTWVGGIPPVGSRINFQNPFPFCLTVVGLSFDEIANVSVELHLGSSSGFNSIQDFIDWWKRQVDESHYRNVAPSFDTKEEYKDYVNNGLGCVPFWFEEAWRKVLPRQRF